MRTALIIRLCFPCCSVVLTLSQGVFGFPCSASEEGKKKLVETARTADLNLAKGIFHTMECPAWYINGGGRLARKDWPLLGNWLGKGQQVLSTCAPHVFLGCSSSLFLLFPLLILLYFTLLPLLNSSYLPISTHLVYLISVLPSIPLQGEWAEDKDWLKDSYCHLGLNSSPGGK